METTSATSATRTTRRVVIQRDVPEAAIAGLAEFIDRYYIRPNMKLIEEPSYRKVESLRGFELYWKLKPLGTETPNPLSVDRKSTRLNSSHRCISYAVFCLK